MLRSFTVFNIAQVDGLPDEFVARPLNPPGRHANEQKTFCLILALSFGMVATVPSIHWQTTGYSCRQLGTFRILQPSTVLHCMS